MADEKPKTINGIEAEPGDRDLSRVPENLRPHAFKPGQSGNPNGRPKRPSFESVIAQVLEEEVESQGLRVTKRELLARVLVDECLKRNSGLIREVLAREWPALQTHAIAGVVEIASEDSREALARRLDRLERGDESDAVVVDLERGSD